MATNHDDASDDEAQTTERIGSEPVDGDGSYPFAGLTRHDEGEGAMLLPENVERDTSSMAHWAVNKAGESFEDGADVTRDLDPAVLPERGLHTLIHELPRANHARAAWVHPRTGKVLETEKHNAVINPDAAEDSIGGYSNYPEAIADVTGRDVKAVREDLGEMSRNAYMEEVLTSSQRETIEVAGVGDDALYQIAGDNHTVINPQQPLEELANELQERDIGDDVFGEVTIDRGGGRATLDVYMDGQHVESPTFADGRNPIVVGLQVQWSFFSDWAFRVCGQGLDWDCVNHISRITDRETVKYSGDVDGRTDWRDLFSEILDALDEKRDQLARIIQHATEETLDFSDLPADLGDRFEDGSPWTALYSYLGLPNYLAGRAGRRLRKQADDAYEPNWWEIHSAATYAVSHHDRGERTAGGSYEDHARVANDMLMNPAAMEGRMVDNYKEARSDDEESDLADEGGGTAEIRTAFESVAEKRERFDEWERELTEMGVEL